MHHAWPCPCCHNHRECVRTEALLCLKSTAFLRSVTALALSTFLSPLLQWFPSLGREVNVVKNSVHKILKELRKMKTGTWKSLPSCEKKKEGKVCAHLLRAHLLISPTEQLECWVWWDLWKNTANAGEPVPPIPAMPQLGETAK